MNGPQVGQYATQHQAASAAEAVILGVESVTDVPIRLVESSWDASECAGGIAAAATGSEARGSRSIERARMGHLRCVGVLQQHRHQETRHES